MARRTPAKPRAAALPAPSSPAVTRAMIVAEARTWIGTPWQHQQRTKALAVDCAGLVIGVARALGLVAADFDVTGYARQADGTLLAVCDAHLRRIEPHQIRPGDVIVVAVDDDPQHLGIVGDYRHGGLSIIHAASVAGRVIETRLMWAGNFALRGAFAFKGVD